MQIYGMKKVSLLFVLLSLSLVVLSQKARAIIVDSQGNVLISKNTGQVLSQGSDDGDPSGSGSSGSGSSDSSSSSSDNGSSGGSSSSGSGSSDSGSGDTKIETTTSGGAVIRTEIRDDGEVRTETRFPDGIRVKTREEEGRTRTDIYEGGTKLRLERRDGRVIIKLENEAGEELELPEGAEDEVFKIEERTEENQVRVRSLGNKFVISRAQTGAQTDFPVTVDLNTNELTITTPSGVKVVTILPDQAVANMLAANVIDQVRGLAFTQDVRRVATGSAATLGNVISLTTTRQGVLVYEIPGVSNQRFLGFVPVEIQKTVVVSADTGELVKVNKPFGSTLLDIVSF